MGTHPIFESDFDCLTECCELLPPAPCPPLPSAVWIQSRPFLSIRSDNMPLIPPPLVVQSEPVRNTPKSKPISRSVFPVPTVVVIWTPSPSSTLPLPICIKMPLMVNVPLISKSHFKSFLMFPYLLTIHKCQL